MKGTRPEIYDREDTTMGLSFIGHDFCSCCFETRKEVDEFIADLIKVRNWVF